MSGRGSIPPLTSAPSTSKNLPLKSNGGCSQVPRSTERNSSVRAYRVALGSVSPNRACSSGCRR